MRNARLAVVRRPLDSEALLVEIRAEQVRQGALLDRILAALAHGRGPRDGADCRLLLAILEAIGDDRSPAPSWCSTPSWRIWVFAGRCSPPTCRNRTNSACSCDDCTGSRSRVRASSGRTTTRARAPSGACDFARMTVASSRRARIVRMTDTPFRRSRRINSRTRDHSISSSSCRASGSTATARRLA